MIKSGVTVILVIILFVFPVHSQHLIGKTKDDITKEVKNFYPGFSIDNSSVNHTYKYLKYIDRLNDQTMLVFLSENDVCTAIKLMSSYSNLLQVKNDLNKKYKTAGKEKWKYTAEGKDYLVEMKREEWFFSVFTSKEK